MALYQIGDGRDDSNEWQLHRARVTGFQEAMRVLGLFDADDVQTIINACHLEVHGETRQERRQRLDGIDKKLEDADWEAFEAPAFERYQPKSKG